MDCYNLFINATISNMPKALKLLFWYLFHFGRICVENLLASHIYRVLNEITLPSSISVIVISTTKFPNVNNRVVKLLNLIEYEYFKYACNNNKM